MEEQRFEHTVQFYSDDSCLAAAVREFVSPALTTGGAVVLMTTRAHLESIDRELEARALSRSEAGIHCISLDATAISRQVLVDDVVDEARFETIARDALDHLPRGGGPVRAFGETAAVLAREGRHDAARQLEALWNRLARRWQVPMLCAYPLRTFSRIADSVAFSRICDEHTQVIPAETYRAEADERNRLRLIAQLQQQAEALQASLASRSAGRTRTSERNFDDLLEREQDAHAQADARRAKDEFLLTVSHELRTPLNALLGWIRMLRADVLSPDKAAHALEVIERNAQMQARVVEELLDVSRIVTGRVHLYIQQVDGGAIVRSVVESLRAVAEAKQIAIDVATGPDAAKMSADPDRWRQIVWNLVSNAVKYTSRGGRVSLRLDRDGTETQLVVRDTGIGIRPELLPYVFDRFSRTLRTLATDGGLGLGLAISRHLVELHGGSIAAHSEGTGRGATFTVRLPATHGRSDLTPLDAAEDVF